MMSSAYDAYDLEFTDIAVIKEKTNSDWTVDEKGFLKFSEIKSSQFHRCVSS